MKKVRGLRTPYPSKPCPNPLMQREGNGVAHLSNYAIVAG